MPLDILAPVYDRYCPIVGLGHAFRQATLRHAGLNPGESVLDVGCGTGVLTRLAAPAVGPTGYAIGIDPAAKMIEVAKKNALTEGSRAEFRLAVIEDLPFEDNRFDCVLSSAMLHHLPPEVKIKGLSEVRRVLKPGGRLVLVDVDRPTVPLWWILLWPLLFWSFTEDQVKGRLGVLMLRAGFSSSEKVGSWGGFLGFWKAFKGKSG
ncbi:MAG: class I SAM-dependent methyltransferase [Deltaproteobacteria bacterium]|nr:class I SAM-dependent methyltransferase [Deltaproteobacteria bacterium]